MCNHCFHALSYTGMRLEQNAVKDKLAGRLPLTYGHALLYFENSRIVQALLHQIKYRNKKRLAVHMGRLWGEELLRLQPEVPFDLIIPVPLAAAKQYKRGYNQSALLAQGLSKVLQVPVREDIIKRIRHTESQTSKNRQERIENILGAFSVAAAPPPGAHILLVDDVITTGATLDICANTLAGSGEYLISVGSLAVKI